jgi:hypothetical protein
LAEIEGVVKGDPVPIDVPPEAAVYQLIVEPAVALAVNETVPVPQRVAPVELMILFVKVTCTGVEVVLTGPFAQVTIH